MAIVTKIPGRPLPPPPARYTVEMSEDEIMIVRAALGRFSNTLTTPIHDSLYNATKDVDQHFGAHIEHGAYLKVERY